MRAYVSITIYDFAKEIDRIAHCFRLIPFTTSGEHINMRHLPKTKENETKKTRG